MSELVTDAMVEAAARAEWTYEWPSRPWEKVPDDLADHYRDCSRRALEAAAPAIAAAAWGEGYAEGGRGRMWDSANPYCADHIERGES